jgi:hypothetical protein
MDWGRAQLRNPAYIAIGDRHMKAVDRIEQTVMFLKDNEKWSRLVRCWCLLHAT